MAECRLLLICAFLFLATQSNPVQARPVSPWSLERIAQRADYLVSGEVIGVAEAGTVAADQNKWHTPLLLMTVVVRPFGAFPQSFLSASTSGQAIQIEYYALDPLNSQPMTDGPQFPHLSSGDTYVFPLRRPQAKDPAHWELIDDEDFNLLVPTAGGRVALLAAPTGLDFLRLELAGAFAKGDYGQLYRAARYLSSFPEPKPEARAPLYKLIEEKVGNDRDRWLSIAAAYYCSMGVPRPTLAAVLEYQGGKLPQLSLLAEALVRAGGERLDERLIEEALRRSGYHTWGTAVTISLNYQNHPTALRLLSESLAKTEPAAIYIAAYLIKQKEHPLCTAAVSAAVRFLKERGEQESGAFSAACQLIRDYGSDRDFAFLLDELRQAQRADRSRYRMIWQSCAYTKNPRLIAVCRIVIGDGERFSGELRFSDVAAFELQRVTGIDFGVAMNQTPEEREQAIARARAWLQTNGGIGKGPDGGGLRYRPASLSQAGHRELI